LLLCNRRRCSFFGKSSSSAWAAKVPKAHFQHHLQRLQSGARPCCSGKLRIRFEGKVKARARAKAWARADEAEATAISCWMMKQSHGQGQRKQQPRGQQHAKFKKVTASGIWQRAAGLASLGFRQTAGAFVSTWPLDIHNSWIEQSCNHA